MAQDSTGTAADRTDQRDALRAENERITNNAIDVMGRCEKHPRNLTWDEWTQLGGTECPLCLRAENEWLEEELQVFVRRDIQHTDENERLERMMKAHRETAVAAIAGAEKQLTEAHTENELLRIAEQRRREEVETAMTRVVELEAENERLQGLVDQWYEIANRLQGVETEIERLRAAYDAMSAGYIERGREIERLRSNTDILDADVRTGWRQKN